MQQKYNKIWEKNSNIKKNFIANRGTINSNWVLQYSLVKAKSMQIFMIKKHPQKTPITCVSVILIDTVPEINKDYYPQVFLKKCKFNSAFYSE